jgi:hypothetical protein
MIKNAWSFAATPPYTFMGSPMFSTTLISIILYSGIERSGRVVKAPASHTGGPELKSRPGDRLS